MRKFEGIGLTAVLAVAAASVSGCDQPDDWQASAGPTKVCVGQDGRRVADDQCPNSGGGSHPVYVSHWVYFNASRVREGVPAVGESVAGASETPEASVAYRAAPTGGIARGGFGGTGEGGGRGGGGGEGGAGE